MEFVTILGMAEYLALHAGEAVCSRAELGGDAVWAIPLWVELTLHLGIKDFLEDEVPLDEGAWPYPGVG